MSFLRATACAALTALPLLLAAGRTEADERLLREYMVDEIRQWASSPVVTLTLEASNQRYAALDQAGIDALDRQWRAERETDDQPLITAVLSSPLSSYLTKIQARSRGLYTEIFVMDARGLNAGQSAITSDFWQGDEDKWLKTFPVGPEALFIDTVEVNEQTGTENVQMNFPITQDGEVVGAITVEVNLTELRRRHEAGKV
jgi:hypothetical protein